MDRLILERFGWTTEKFRSKGIDARSVMRDTELDLSTLPWMDPGFFGEGKPQWYALMTVEGKEKKVSRRGTWG